MSSLSDDNHIDVTSWLTDNNCRQGHLLYTIICIIPIWIGLDWWSLIWRYSPLFWADSLRSHVILHEWIAFYSVFCFVFVFDIHGSGVLTALAWLVPHETATVSAQVMCTPYNHASYHFMQSHISKVYACLAVTCHLHFWQNERDILRAIKS